jgi:hypothetical protein
MGRAMCLILAALFVVLAAAAAVVVVLLTHGHHRHTVRWLLLIGFETFPALTFGRLLWITRPTRRARAGR